MKQELKVGDRVHVYGSVLREYGGEPRRIDCNRGLGEVKHAEGSCVWVVLVRSGLIGPGHPGQWKDAVIIAHPKQCRRLKTKPKPLKDAREIWVNEYPEIAFSDSNAYESKEIADKKAYLHTRISTSRFIEVERIPVSK